MSSYIQKRKRYDSSMIRGDMKQTFGRWVPHVGSLDVG